jgi:hypothetical protein
LPQPFFNSRISPNDTGKSEQSAHTPLSLTRIRRGAADEDAHRILNGSRNMHYSAGMTEDEILADFSETVIHKRSVTGCTLVVNSAMRTKSRLTRQR